MTGWMSRKATAASVSRTFAAGISPRMILQKRQLGWCGWGCDVTAVRLLVPDEACSFSRRVRAGDRFLTLARLAPGTLTPTLSRPGGSGSGRAASRSFTYDEATTAGRA